MRRLKPVTLWTIILVLFGAAAPALAQDASVAGTVVDESRAVLPGVTVTATGLETGRQFTALTSARGEYRLVGLPAGRYRLSAELPGFAPTILENMELLVGQNATISITLKIGTVEQSVTVSGESPLIDLAQARVSGNVDRRQMDQLPIAGRNWQQLSMMVKGITANTVVNQPGVIRDAAFQLNLDGQQITQNLCCSGFGNQPGISRDAIAEFQIITNLFDVTMGRSVGIQVQAVSRAGTNNLDGSAYGFFRDDNFNAQDAFAKRVLPYSDKQIGGTVGGPLIKDKAHYFVSYEYEREPNTIVLAPPALPGQVFSMPSLREVNNALGRADYQLSPRNHLSVRSAYWRSVQPHEPRNLPASTEFRQFDSRFTSGTWSLVGNNNLLHEIKVDHYHYHWLLTPAAGTPLIPQYIFPGLTVGVDWALPEDFNEDFLTTRYDLRWHKKSHDFKMGAEVRVGSDNGWWVSLSRGQLRFSSTPADLSRRIPADAATDPSRWDLTGLDSTGLRFDINYARFGGGIDDKGDWSFRVPRPSIAGWFGDTWGLNSRLTLNLGVRYDVAWEDLSPPGITETELVIDTGRSADNFGYRNNIRDLNNVAPRAGFAWNVTDRNDLVIRGGTGLYFGTAAGNQLIDESLWNGQRVVSNSYVNDGRPGWVLDPTRGVTTEDVLSGKVPRQPQSISIIAQDFRMPVTWQAMLGFQKQLTDVMGVDADLIWYRGRQEDSQRNPNLFYDPATGLPKNPNTFGRPRPDFGAINLKESHGRSDYLALATSFTRRYRRNFEVGATYTVMFYKHDTGVGSAGYGAMQLNTFNIMDDWSRSSDFQRHTVRLNGIWNLPWGIGLASSFRYGSGNYSNVTTNVDPLGLGANRIRSNLTIIPRNTFHLDPYHSLDLRLSKDIRVAGDLKLSGIAEVFNLYNYASYGYNRLETSPNFGKPNASGAPPRTVQLAFRVSF